MTVHPRQMAIGAAVLCGFLPLSAGALSIDVFAVLDLDESAIDVVSAETGEPVDPGSALALDLLPEATSSRTRLEDEKVVTNRVQEVGSVANLLDDALTVRLPATISYTFDYRLDDPVDFPFAYAFGAIEVSSRPRTTFVPGTGFERDFDALGCDAIPCFASRSGMSTLPIVFPLAAGATESVSVALRTNASALVPVPATLAPAALALGGLAWVGRRKLRE